MQLEPIDFHRPIPLFPLPNCVLFPGVVQPLHIFEPRYQQMMAHALADQSVLAIALLKPGWEKNYYGSPDIHPLLCVGRIVTHEKLGGKDNGKYNLLLHGVSAPRSSPSKNPRTPSSAPPNSTPSPTPRRGGSIPPAANAQSLQRKVLSELFHKTSLKHLTITPSLLTLFDSPVATPRLIDVLCFTLVQDVPTKQRLLEQLCPIKRGELLLRELLALAHHLDKNPPTPEPAATPAWPPPLSAN